MEKMVNENGLTRDQQIELEESNLALARAFLDLSVDPKFVAVFEEKFINAFALTNIHNMAVMTPEARARTHEKMIARSHFSQFCQQIVIDGEIAVTNLAELKADADEQAEQE